MDPALGFSMIILRRKRWLKILNVLCIQFSLVDAPYALSIFWECKFWRMTKTKIITKVLKILPKKTRISKIKAIQFFSKFLVRHCYYCNHLWQQAYDTFMSSHTCRRLVRRISQRLCPCSEQHFLPWTRFCSFAAVGWC